MNAVSFTNIKKFGAFVLLALIIVPLVFGCIALYQQNEKYGIGALIDLQHQKKIKDVGEQELFKDVPYSKEVLEAISEAEVEVGMGQSTSWASGKSNFYFIEALPVNWGQKSKMQAIKKFVPASGQKKFHLFGGTLTFESSCDDKTSTVTVVENGYKATSYQQYLCLPTVSWVHYMH